MCLCPTPCMIPRVTGDHAALLSSTCPFPGPLSLFTFLLHPRPSYTSILFACYHNAVACVSRSLLSLLAVEYLHSFYLPTSWLLTFFSTGKNDLDPSSTGISWNIILFYDHFSTSACAVLSAPFQNDLLRSLDELVRTEQLCQPDFISGQLQLRRTTQPDTNFDSSSSKFC